MLLGKYQWQNSVDGIELGAKNVVNFLVDGIELGAKNV